ncbi:MAG: response regulator [Candidatus Delongbacteria bacterium]
MKPGEARILVVDDDATTRFLARTVLEAQGCRVSEAANGREAVEQFLAAPFDLVLMDVQMPELDGFSACREIRRLPGGRDCLLLMLSGLEDADSLERASQAGAFDFLGKPLDYPALGRRVRLMLSNRPAATDHGFIAPWSRDQALLRLEGLLSQARRHGRRVAVLAIRPVAELQLGRLATRPERDLRRAAAERVQAHLRLEDAGDPVEWERRWADGADDERPADETPWLILLGDLHGPDDAARAAGRLAGSLTAPHPQDGQPGLPCPRLGIALFPEDGGTAEALVERALAACSLAAEGRTPIRFHDAAQDALTRERLLLASELATVLADQGLDLHAQPVRLATGGLAGARLRPGWRHPRLGFLASAELEELAREGGLERDLALTQLRQAGALQQGLPRPACRLTLGLPAPLLGEPTLHDRLDELAGAGPLDWLELKCRGLPAFLKVQGAELPARLLRLGLRLAVGAEGFGLEPGGLDSLPGTRLCLSVAGWRAGPTGLARALAAVGELARAQGLALRLEDVDHDAEREAALAAGCDEWTGGLAGPLVPVAEFLATHADRRRPTPEESA